MKMPSTAAIALCKFKALADTITSKVYPFIIMLYLELVARTSRIIVEGDTDQMGNSVVGFWHTDSCSMNLMLRAMRSQNGSFSVITTADKRGDYIAKIIHHYGAKSIRLPDGIQMRRFLKDLKQSCKTNISNLCIALDGPLGPLKEPKKLGFMLANYSEKNFIYVKATYSKKLSLRSRWDNYVIPLPFTKIRFFVKDIGDISNSDLREFENLKKKIALI